MNLSLEQIETLPLPELEVFLQKVIGEKVSQLSPDEALRFLFRLDAALYVLEGKQSIVYDRGTHTKHRHINYHQFFVKRIQKGRQVLDVGCGKGELAYAIATQSEAAVCGMDLNKDHIQHATERYSHPNITYQFGDVLTDLGEREFDIVVLSNILEHLPERPKFLKQLQSVTKAKQFLLRVPLFERDWRVPLKKELEVEWRLDLTHYTEYTQETFLEEMKAANLKIIHQEVRWGEIWAEVSGNVS